MCVSRRGGRFITPPKDELKGRHHQLTPLTRNQHGIKMGEDYEL